MGILAGLPFGKDTLTGLDEGRSVLVPHGTDGFIRGFAFPQDDDGLVDFVHQFETQTSRCHLYGRHILQESGWILNFKNLLTRKLLRANIRLC